MILVGVQGELVWSRQGKQKTKSTLENTDLETVLEQDRI